MSLFFNGKELVLLIRLILIEVYLVASHYSKIMRKNSCLRSNMITCLAGGINDLYPFTIVQEILMWDQSLVLKVFLHVYNID